MDKPKNWNQRAQVAMKRALLLIEDYERSVYSGQYPFTELIEEMSDLINTRANKGANKGAFQ